MRRTKNSSSFDVASIKQLARDERCLDRFAHTNVVGDE
jgi:hypothetical protein